MMTDLWFFLLKASLSMSMLYLVYWFFLRKETLFLTTRYYLIGALLLSVILPFISIRYTLPYEGSSTVRDTLGAVLQQGADSSRGGAGLSPWLLFAGRLYLFGATIFLLRIIIQFTVLAWLMARNGITVVDNTRIVYNTRYRMPFSFLNLVFINPENTRQNELSDIIAHEKVHIRENHWLDLLVVELLSIILWFNPFIWFFERSIKQNHEYLADEGVIAQGYNVGRYHSVLINQLLGMEVIGITNNLNYSLNAKRLKMMKREKTPKNRALHVMWALPVVFLLLAAFARPAYENEPLPGDAEKIILPAREITVTVAVLDKSGDPLPGASIVVKGTEKGTKTDSKGIFTMAVSDTDVIIVSVKGYEDSYIDMKKISEKEGTSGSYKFKVVMKSLSDNGTDKEIQMKKEAIAKEAYAKSGSGPETAKSEEEMIKELEITLKKLAVRKDELNHQKDKIAQAEKDGVVDKKELDKKKAALAGEMKAVESKISEVTKKLDSFKK